MEAAPLVVETARQVLDFAGGTLIMPMTVLVQTYWTEIRDGLAAHRIPVRHFLLHADAGTLRDRIANDTVMGHSTFRMQYVEPYVHAYESWLRDEAEVVDTVGVPAADAAQRISAAVNG